MEEKITIEKTKEITLPNIGDSRGYLVVCEGDKDIPFSPVRIFYIYGTRSDIVRGNHANYRSEFVLINVAGRSKIKVLDGYGGSKIYELDRPHTGIYLPKMIWKEMYDFSEDSVLLCLASEHYDPEEYIKDFDEYVRIVNEKEQKI